MTLYLGAVVGGGTAVGRMHALVLLARHSSKLKHKEYIVMHCFWGWAPGGCLCMFVCLPYMSSLPHYSLLVQLALSSPGIACVAYLLLSKLHITGLFGAEAAMVATSCLILTYPYYL